MTNIPRSSYYRRTPSPCKNCDKRYLGCHSQCEDYKEWKIKEQEEHAKAINKQKAERMQEDILIKANIQRRKSRRYR